MKLFCPICGENISIEDKTCPSCGHTNIYYKENLKNEITRTIENNDKEKKFFVKSNISTMVIGFVMLIVGICLTLNSLEKNIFMVLESFSCAVCGGVSFVFSIIAICKSENTTKLTIISLITSIILALTHIPMILYFNMF